MRRLRRVWRRALTEARWLRDRYLPVELDPYFQGPDPVVPKEPAPYDWAESDDWSWAEEHEADVRAARSQPEPSVRECCLSDQERRAWAEIVASWRRP